MEITREELKQKIKWNIFARGGKTPLFPFIITLFECKIKDDSRDFDVVLREIFNELKEEIFG